MIRLVLTDMDGTLLPAGWEHVSPLALEAIAALDAAGVRFGPASGRDLDDVASFFYDDPSRMRVAVLSNGQKIRLDGKLVKAMSYDRSGLERLKALIDQTPGTILCVPVDGEPSLVMGPAAERTGEFPPSWFPVGVRVVDELPEGDVAKAGIACFGTLEHCAEVMATFAAAVPEIRFVCPINQWFDLIVPGWSKAKGIKWLCGHLGLSLDEVCVFGDSDNDAEMLALVPNSVAVAGASPAAEAAARWHIGPAGEDSVAQALMVIAVASRVGRMPSFMS